jgi:hypothetical protein
LREDCFFADVLRDDDLRDVDLRDDDFRDDDFFADLRPLLFVSPACRRCLLTVAAAIRFAVAVLRPRFLADALIFSY